jgi:hypothetical protein
MNKTCLDRYIREPYARILKVHSHSKSGGSIWASLECQCCFWIAGGLVSYLLCDYSPSSYSKTTLTLKGSSDWRLYSKSSLTLKEWRFNLSFSWVSVLFLNSWRVSIVTYYVTTHATAIQKQHWHSREAQIDACILKAHSHSMSGGSIWASLECQCCFWIAGRLVSYSLG